MTTKFTDFVTVGDCWWQLESFVSDVFGGFMSTVEESCIQVKSLWVISLPNNSWGCRSQVRWKRRGCYSVSMERYCVHIQGSPCRAQLPLTKKNNHNHKINHKSSTFIDKKPHIHPCKNLQQLCQHVKRNSGGKWHKIRSQSYNWHGLRLGVLLEVIATILSKLVYFTYLWDLQPRDEIFQRYPWQPH